MSISKRSKEYLTVAFADQEVANEVIELLNTADRLVRRMEALLQKMDSDTGISDTDYEDTVESVD
jgi:uncharacterized protein with PhoU and TrkA domain